MRSLYLLYQFFQVLFRKPITGANLSAQPFLFKRVRLFGISADLKLQSLIRVIEPLLLHPSCNGSMQLLFQSSNKIFLAHAILLTPAYPINDISFIGHIRPDIQGVYGNKGDSGLTCCCRKLLRFLLSSLVIVGKIYNTSHVSPLALAHGAMAVTVRPATP